MSEELMSIEKFARFSCIFVAMFAITGAMGTGRVSDNRIRPKVADYARSLSFEPNRGQTDK